ncbi:MAG: ribonuclease Y [Clostridiales bacterium]|nr:ribonuclease Y [Clostridiales bacterium]
MPNVITIIIGIVGFIFAIIIGFILGIAYRKKVAEAEIGSAEEKAKSILADAEKLAKSKKKETLLEAKEEIIRNRNEAEKELKERRNEVSRLEKRALQREEAIEHKYEAFEKKEEALANKMKETEARLASIEEVKQEQLKRLEEISGLTAEQAKADLLSKIEEELEHETALRITEAENSFKEDAEQKAREIISATIQRYASEHVSEATVSVVALPSDDMKGRIIGREGRNIRTIEQMTGCDLIIDDTPEAITLSSFDPVRRETARIALEKLITDGRIHPARIEETVEKARKEVETAIKKAGEKATFDTGIHGINHELIKILGRLKYRTSYGQNVLDHSIEVAFISGMLAEELGVDATIAKRAGLLHDIGKAMTQEVEGSHVQIGVDLAKKYRESKEVVHAIEAHHGDVEAKTVIAQIVQAADAISAARPGARRENVENYIKRLQKLEEIATSFEGVEKSYAIQAGREVRIMVKPEQISDDKMVIVAHDIVKKVEEELKYPGQIKIHVIRESRAIDFAK